ncbi:hypothetical protein E8E11_005951 [Didymella keratinophila]|nr:hypothetical protein E8E11_005951 [Didymella keratinophila]
MSRTALFVIDIQHALASSPSTRVPHATRIIDAGTQILNDARSIISGSLTRGEPAFLDIIVVQHSESPSEGPLQKDSTEWELVFPPLGLDWTSHTGSERLVSKDVRDTFESNPSLAAELKERDVGTIVAFGVQSECCVLSTCRGGLAAGFEVVLLRGAHSTYDTGTQTALEIERGVEDLLEKEGKRLWVGMPLVVKYAMQSMGSREPLAT